MSNRQVSNRILFRTTAGGMKLRQFYTLLVRAVSKNDNLGRYPSCFLHSLPRFKLFFYTFQNNFKLKTHLRTRNSNLNFITPKLLLYPIYLKMCWNLHLPLLTMSGYGFLAGKHSSNAMPLNWSVKEFIIKPVNMKIIYTIVSPHMSIFILTS